MTGKKKVNKKTTPPPPPPPRQKQGRNRIPSPPPSPPSSSSPPTPHRLQPLVSPLPPQPPSSSGQEYGNKLVYFSFSKHTAPLGPEKKSWAMVDPNYKKEVTPNKFGFELLPEMKFPAHFDIVNYIGYTIAVFESNVYFIGGKYKLPDSKAAKNRYDYYSYHYHDRDRYTYSGKVFIYDLKAKTWEESSSRLNVPRAYSRVHVIGKVIYLFGGESKNIDRDTWIECYGLDHNKNINRKWKILPTPVPYEVYCVATPDCVVYERGCQIVFIASSDEIFSFNYVRKTWKLLCEKIGNNEHGQISFKTVAVVRDTLFCVDTRWATTLYGFDLCNNAMLNCVRYFENTISRKGNRKPLLLFSVVNDTLLLFYCNHRGLCCYKYHIDNSLEGSWGFHLVDGCQQVESSVEGIIESFVV